MKFKHKGCAVLSGLVSLLLLSKVQFQKEDSLLSIIGASFIIFLTFFLLSYFINCYIVSQFSPRKSTSRSRNKKLLKPSEVDYDLSEEAELPPDDPAPEKSDVSQPEKVFSDKEMDAAYTIKDATVLWELRATALKNSVTPEDFFQRYDDLVDYAEEILEADSVWVSSNGSSSISEESRENVNDVARGKCFDDELTAFIERSFEDAKIRCSSKQNVPARKNIARKWHDSFDPYLSRMSEKEIQLLHEKYGELLIASKNLNMISL